MRDAESEGIAGFGEWVELSQALMHGLAHALSNRITSLGAYAELAGMGDRELTSTSLLKDEMGRLQQLNLRFQLILAQDAQPAAMELGPLLEDVIALHAYHTRVRAIRCIVERTGTMQPLRLVRQSALRLLLILLDNASVGAVEAGRQSVTVTLEGEDDWLTIRIASPSDPSRYAVMLAQQCGATLARADNEVVLRFPTLRALRSQEKAGLK